MGKEWAGRVPHHFLHPGQRNLRTIELHGAQYQAGVGAAGTIEQRSGRDCAYAYV